MHARLLRSTGLFCVALLPWIGSTAANAASPIIAQGAGPLSVTMSEDGAPTPWNAPTLSATDPDGDTLTWSVSSAANNGSATVAGTGISPSDFTYAPKANWNGADRFTVQVADSTGGLDTIIINVTVQALNDAPQIQISQPATYVSQWGGQGDGPGQFYIPYAIELDASGNVYVADTYNHRIQKFDADGNFIKQWGSSGTENGQFLYPRDMAVIPTGLMYILDTGNNRIQKFTTDGDYISQWGSEGTGDAQFLFPTGIAADSAYNVYVSEANNYRVQKFNSAGIFLTKWGSPGYEDNQFASPAGVAVDSANAVYVADLGSDRIKKFDAEGRFLNQWGGFSGPAGVVVDLGGTVYVSEAFANRIQTFDTNGNPIAQWGAYGSGNGEFSDPHDIEVDRFGFVYVADANNHRIQKFALRATAGLTQNVTMSEDGVPTAFNLPLYVIDADGDATTWSLLSPAGHGAASVTGTGDSPASCTYVPNPNWSGSDGFVIQVSDGHGGADNLTVNITVEPVNDPPTITQGDGPLTVTMSEDGVPTGWTPPALGATDNDPGETAALTWQVSSPATYGTATVSGTGAAPASFEYTPDAYWNGSDSFIIEVSDGQGGADSIQIDVTVQPVPNAPIIDQGDGPLEVTMSEDGTPTPWTPPDLSASDPDADPMAWSVAAPASHGAATVSGEGAAPSTFDYAPNPDWTGADSFTIQVADDAGKSDTIVVNVTVQAVNDAPQILVPSLGGSRAVLITQWGSSAYGPAGIALDNAGTIYATDMLSNDINLFDEQGNTLAEWGGTGSENGQFNAPYGVAVNAAGEVFVVDSNNNRIQKFDASGVFLTKWGNYGSADGNFQYPRGIAVDAAGNVFVADTRNHRIQKFDTTGLYLAQFGTSGNGDGQLNEPYGVATDSLGNLYVADSLNNRIQKFDPNGAYLSHWGGAGSNPGQFSQPRALTLDSLDNVYVADTYNARVQVFDANGAFITMWNLVGNDSDNFRTPMGIAVNDLGFIYVTDNGNQRIQKYLQLGAAGPEGSSFVVTMSEDGEPTPFDLTLGANDADGDTLLTWSIASPAANGTADISAPGQGDRMPILYVPDENFVGTNYFDVSVHDANNAVSTVTIEVIVQPVSDGGPVITQGAGPLNVTMSEDGSPKAWVPPALSATDPDPDNTLSWSVSSPAAHGIATVSGDGESPAVFSYVPNENWSGADTFSIQVADGTGNTDTIAVNVTVQTIIDVPKILISSTEGTVRFISQWGDAGEGSGQFRGPLGLALDAADNLYVADSGNARIQKFDPNGVFLAQWGEPGSGDGQFDLPAAITVDHAGIVYVADERNHRIQKFDPNGIFLAQWGGQGTANGQFDQPWGVAVDSLGNVFTTEYINCRIQKFDPDGAYLTQWGSNGMEIGQFCLPYEISIDHNDNIYVADAHCHRIKKFDANGAFLEQWGGPGAGNGQFAYPRRVSVDRAGNMYVSDTFNNRIQKLAPNGNFLEKWGSEGSGIGQFSLPWGLVIDSLANVYVADYANQRIQKFAQVLPAGNTYDITMSEDGSPKPWRSPAIIADDIEGFGLNWSLVTPPTHGTATVSGTSESPDSFNYVPDPDWNGVDHFSVEVLDNNGGSDTITFNVNVEPVNDRILTIVQGPGPLEITMSEDSDPTTWNAPALSAIDPDTGNQVNWSLASPPSHGSAEISGAGSSPDALNYTPLPNWNGIDSFTVQADDDFQNSATIVINVTVEAVNDPPVLEPIGNKIAFVGIELSFPIVITDLDTDSCGFSTTNTPGDAQYDPFTGRFIWTPGVNDIGMHDNIIFRVHDNTPPYLSDSETISIEVLAAPEGEGEGITPEGEGEGITPEGEGEGITPEGEGEGITPEGEGEGITPEGEGEGLLEGEGEGLLEGEGEGLLEGEGQTPTSHSADQNGDYKISLTELLRVIQFFNLRAYYCVTAPDTSEDGYLPGPGDDHGCTPHQSDYNPQDWKINLTELLRLIQFFNLRGYHPCPDDATEDGYCPGAA